MTSDHQHFRHALAAYAIGALGPPERAELEAHLESCAACRDELGVLASLPGLLGRVTEEEVRGDQLRLSDGHLERVLAAAGSAARRERRSRLGRVLIAAAAAVVAVAVVVWAPWAGPTGTRYDGQVVAAASDASVTAFVDERAWGMAVTLEARDLPERGGYALWAVADDGHRAHVASWSYVPAPVVTIEGSCYLQVSEVTQLVITAQDDEVIASVDVAV